MSPNIAKRDVNSIEQLQRYLQKSTAKADNLYHYTSYEALVSIIKNHCFRLTRMDLLNDKAEQKLSSTDEHLKNYIISFTQEKEYVSMWAMYGKSSGIKLRLDFPKSIFENSINNNFFSNVACTEKIPLYSNDVPGAFSKKDFLISDVVYLDKAKNQYRHREKKFPDITATDDYNRQLTGFVKYDAWEFEREVRLRALLYHDLEIDGHRAVVPPFIFVKIGNEVIKQFHVTFNPWLSSDMKEEIKKSLDGLAGIHLAYDNSQHDGEISNM